MVDIKKNLQDVTKEAKEELDRRHEKSVEHNLQVALDLCYNCAKQGKYEVSTTILDTPFMLIPNVAISTQTDHLISRLEELGLVVTRSTYTGYFGISWYP